MKKYLKHANFEVPKNLSNKRVLIYGVGELFQCAYENYDFSGVNIIGVSDMRFNETTEFMGFCAVSPDNITSLKPDVILVAIKEYKSLVKRFTNQFPGIEVLPLCKKPHIPAFVRRNINHNLWIETHGLHNKKPKKISKLKELSIKINNALDRIDIPQIEFNLTTRCTLRCKHCSNFIPQIKSDEHSSISIEEFKIELDNLLKAAHRIKNLILIGGEPLLVKNLDEYIVYAASKNQVERVWIVTNGTLLIPEKVLSTAKKYNHKFTIWLSNYSKNEELKSKLKHEEILKQIQDANLDYDYKQDLSWGYTSPINSEALRNTSYEYFEECSNHCVSVFANKMYVCPRAGIFALKGIYSPKENETIDLSNRVSKKQLKTFYSQEYFSACNYCTINEDRLQESVIPALQL